MAGNTSLDCRSLTIYSVFTRNHTKEGTFEALRRDLPRIRELGVDVIWLLPIHPLGEKARKGVLGSPYAIRDYRAVNPEFGSLEDFQRLTDAIHALGMRCIIDVVYNHTSPDSVLAQEHPEWFYHKPDGSFGNRVGDWTDIIDLDYGSAALWDYQIDTLKYWATMVDGFRCDVAPLVPLDFWLRARAEVEAVRPGCLWLAESVEGFCVSSWRAEGLPALSDGELYRAFDLCYDYDIYSALRGCWEGKLPLERYAQAVNRQEEIYPANYCKLRFLENHDRPRAAFLLPDEKALLNWTAFSFFQKGAGFLYAGQERGCVHTPSLFHKDPVDWSGPDYSALVKKLCALKKHPLMARGGYDAAALPGDFLRAVHRDGENRLVGLFSMKGRAAPVETGLPDGWYQDLLGGGLTEVRDGLASCRGWPMVLERSVSVGTHGAD